VASKTHRSILIHILLSISSCNGTYACVWDDRYTYCNDRNTVANVDASDSRCRCIAKIIARDLSLVASRLYRKAVTRPRVTCRHYSIPLFRRRPPGLHKPYKRNGKERKALNNHAGYVLVLIQKSRFRLAPYGSLLVDLAPGQTPPPIDWDLEVVKPVPTPFIPGRDPMK